MSDDPKKTATPDYASCAACPYDWSERYCHHKGGKAPANCPSIRHRDLVQQALNRLEDPEILRFSKECSLQEADGYGNREQGYANVHPIKPRIVETMEFARRMGYRRLGLAFCMGLRKEAAVVQRIFEDNGFEVVSVACKAGRSPKTELGIGRKGQVDPTAEVETMCNPILQALVVNESGAELNVLVGLCVGHDSLFIRHAKAPVTVLAAKDRLLGHNPLAAVYTYDSYYRSLKNPKRD